jgi:gliding motility-associated-like protein
MKIVLSAVLTLFISIGFSQLKSITYEVETMSHAGHGHEENPEKRKEMLKDFDYAAYEVYFTSLNIPQNEHDGLLKFKENEYIMEKFPNYFGSFSADPGPKTVKPSGIPTKAIGCPNAGFENLVFAPEWQGGIETYANPFNNFTIVSNGLNALHSDPNSRHTILNIPPGNDGSSPGPIVGYDPQAVNGAGIAEIPFVAPFGGNASVRLGNSNTGSQKERLRYVFTVTPNNKAFYYQFAVVFNNPAGHTNTEPYFKIRFMDSTGNVVGGPCGQYNIISTQAPTDPTYTAFAGGSSYYRKWERVNVDLSPYIGQDITVEFENADCNLGGHWGYAYVDAGCLENLDAAVDYCAGDTYAQLVAEPGFSNYQWFGPNSMIPIAGATNDTLLIPTPNLGDTFTVEITTSNGCVIVQNIAIQYSQTALNELYTTGTCYRGTFGSALAQGTGSQSGYVYTWTVPGSTVPILTNSTGIITGLPAGTYNMNLASNNANCGMIDTSFVIPTVPPMIPDTIQSKFCEGEGIINAPANGTNYQWYNNTGAAVPAPGGTQNFYIDSTAFQGEIVYMSYKLPNGCYDSNVYVLNDNIAPSYFTIQQMPGTGCRSRRITYFDATPASNLKNYIINGPNGFNSTTFSTSATIWNYNNLDTGIYTVRIVDDGCFYDTTFHIDDLTDSVTTIVVFCPGTPVNLTALLNGNHSWTNPAGGSLGGGFGTYQMAVPAPVEGSYIDSSLVSPGCYFVSTFNLDSISLIAAYSVNEPDCYGGFDGSIQGTIVQQGVTGPATYMTTGPNGYTSSSNPANNLPAGTYTIVATVSTCITTNTVIVNQPPFPNDTLWMYTQPCDEIPEGTIYGPQGYINYQWFADGVEISGANQDTLKVGIPVNYDLITVTYTNPVTGCKQKTSEFQFEPFSFNFVPDEFNNVFTPNGDATNNFYYPIHADKSVDNLAYLQGDYLMTIFNRWGNKVFQTDNYLRGWDGTSGGDPAKDGTYFAEIMFRTKCDDQIVKLVQVVQLIR